MRIKRKLFLILAIFIAVFVFFIYILTRQSLESKAIAAINSSMNIEDVKSVWYKFREDIYGNQPNKIDILNSDFIGAVYSKLKELRPSTKDVRSINEWLPAQESLNVIIIPDLSLRIKDTIDNPNQVQNDKDVLGAIWDNFEAKSAKKINSNDRLLIDVADPQQSQGAFRTIADSLLFTLSNHKNKINRLYFPDKKKRFSTYVDKLYNTAVILTNGADYTYYFSQVLPLRIQKNTVDNKYRNLVFIPTDGYLEISVQKSAISITPPDSELQAYCRQGRIPNIKLPVETIGITYPDIEVYLLEVNERKKGLNCHVKGLKYWWKQWFKQLEIKNVDEDNFFNPRQDAMNLTKSTIAKIFE